MTADANSIAREVLAALDDGKQIPPFSARSEDFDLATAYAVAAALRALRRERGETPVGRKIGFTNRTMWPDYGVYTPIWGDMYDSSVLEIADLAGALRLEHFCDPRIEPEIVFKLAAAPRPEMNEAALLDCIEWVGHGFEIVQSIFPGWRFSAADCVAAQGLHGAFLLGPRRGIDRNLDWLRALSAFEIRLFRDGAPVGRGLAADVLDGPLSALRYLVGLLADDQANPPLAAGEIITTGSVTKAFPIAAGERWSTEIEGLPLVGISLSFA